MLVNFYNRLVEACWLTTVVSIPLFFNPYTTRVFESDKTYLLRSITIIMVLAYLIKNIGIFVTKGVIGQKVNDKFEIEKIKESSIKIIPIFISILCLIYFISSIFSIAPYFSFKGYFLREEGFYTLICYLLIFFIVFKSMQSTDQLDRLINVIILTATIVSLYGVLQSFKIDTVSWAGGERNRVTTTLGNPIFAGAFLIMVIPLVIYRLVEYTGKGLRYNFMPIVLYAIILIVNVACLILTKSRGPFIGLVISLFLFIILFARLKQMRWLFITVVALTLASIVFFLVLNIPRGPLSGIKKHFGRFGELYETQQGSGKVRLLIWEGAVSILKSSPSRLFFGHGLESLFPLYHQHIPSSFAHYEGSAIPDHSHNETFDMLITSGVTGVFVYMAIIFLLIYYVLKHIGILSSPQSRRLFTLLIPAAVIVGVLIPLVLHRTSLLGLTIPFSLLSGVISYLLITWKIEISLPGRDFLFLLVGLISAIVGHFSELQFGIGVTSTRLYFWIYIAIILFIFKSISYTQKKDAPTGLLPAWGGSEEKQQGRLWRPDARPVRDVNNEVQGKKDFINQAITYGLISGLILAFFSFELLKKKFVLEGIPPTFYYVILSVGLFSVLFTTLIIRYSSFFTSAFISLCTTILWGGVFYLSFTFLISDFTKVATIFINFCYIFIGLTLIVLSGFIPKSRAEIFNPDAPHSPPVRAGLHILCSMFLLPIAIIMIYYTNLREVHSDIFCREGENYEKLQKWQESINNYTKSIELSPRSDYYYACLSRSYKGNNDYPKAIETLRNALLVNPLNPFHHIEIARSYRDWAETFKDNPAERDSKLALSLEEYQKLSILTPQNPNVFKEKGEIYLLKKDYEKSIEQYLHSLSLDDQLLEVYIRLGRTYRQLNRIDKSIEAYEGAYHLDNKAARYELIKLGEEFFNQNGFEDSLKVNLALISLDPQDYQHHHNAAVVLDQLGRIDEAIEHSRKAIDLIPVSTQKEGVKKFLQKLEEKRKK